MEKVLDEMVEVEKVVEELVEVVEVEVEGAPGEGCAHPLFLPSTTCTS